MTTREDLDQEISTTEKQIDQIVDTLSGLRTNQHFAPANKRIKIAIEFWESRLSKLMDYRRTLR
jgi:hypothetical protein